MTGLALSVRQPWAQAIVEGDKSVEYRSFPTRLRGRVYIYASKGVDEDDLETVQGLVRGAVIGSVEIVGCGWDPAEQAFAWALANPTLLPKPRKPANRANPVFFRPWENAPDLSGAASGEDPNAPVRAPSPKARGRRSPAPVPRPVAAAIETPDFDKWEWHDMERAHGDWKWTAAKVDAKQEHFEIRCTDAEDPSKARDFPLVARVGRPSAAKPSAFRVEFVATPDCSRALAARLRRHVRDDLDFRLVELKQKDAWRAALTYSKGRINKRARVRWSYRLARS